MTSIYDARYIKIIDELKALRKQKKITQEELSEKLRQPQSYVSKIEGLERRIDIIELYDWLSALEISPQDFLSQIGWFVERTSNESLPALPIPKRVKEHEKGILLQLAWQGEVKEVLIEGATPEAYLDIEKHVSEIFRGLNSPSSTKKNRVAICEAFEYAISKLPKVNPSDIYHHLIYRFYLREYSKTQADRSWVRAGGEALELFIERHYTPILKTHGIVIKALISSAEKQKALKQLGLSSKVGGSKLDVALYGKHNGKQIIFGGIHVKASLAERVSDDVPCSVEMMKRGFVSILYTFDAKSFPPPNGDLINRGELGTIECPSDKRKYIEEHGSFDVCFSYNLKTIASCATTKSCKRIYVSSLEATDPIIEFICSKWKLFQKKLR